MKVPDGGRKNLSDLELKNCFFQRDSKMQDALTQEFGQRQCYGTAYG